VIADPGEILHAATPDQDDGMFLEVMTDARNISSHLDAVREAYSGHFAQRRIGFFWVSWCTPARTPRAFGGSVATPDY